MRKNWLTTLAGIMVGLGQIPLGLQYAHLPFALPLWWNAAQFPLWLIGTIGGVLVGVAAKGVDEHSDVKQVEASTVQKTADALVKQASEPAKEPTKVAIVPPLDPEVLKSPDAAAAEIERLREMLNHPSPEK